jgi:allophanate hydrolase subunit 2
MATTYKVLGQAAPATTSDVDIYTVPATTSAVVSTLTIANTTSTMATCRVYICVAAAATSAANAVMYDTKIAANSHIGITEGWTLGDGDIVTVQSGTANALTFTLFGSEIA